MSSVTRVLLLSDTHGQIHRQILQLAAEVDLVVHAGDIGNAGVLDQLTKSKGSLLAVLGNNDVPSKWPATELDRLKELPQQAQVALPDGLLVVTHGHKLNPVRERHQLLRDQFPEARLIVYGHSHRRTLDQSVKPWIANPGAAGHSRTYGGSSCFLLDIDQRGWRLLPKVFTLKEGF